MTQITADTKDDSSLLDDKNTIFGNYLTAKGYKIIYENVLFIVFEVWRLWALTDGVCTIKITRIQCFYLQ